MYLSSPLETRAFLSLRFSFPIDHEEFPMRRNLLFIVLSAFVFVASEASAEDRPNILFAIADDASFPHMGAYGCSWVKTPGFDRVAREGLLFRNAYTPNAKCSPSRACILTGRNSWQLEEAANHIPYFPAKFKTYAEALSENGYFVGKTAKGWAPGVAKDANGKRRQLTGKPFDKRKLKPPARAISSTDYAGNFVDFLDTRPKDSPFCFWYGCLEPHRAYEYGVGARLAGKKPSDLDGVPAYWPDEEHVRNDILDYAFEIEYFDSHLVRMLAEVEKRGELDNTIVVVTSDNGMPFARAKGQAYEISNHLPLAIMWKKGIVKPGRVIDDYVSFIDFAPTFVEIAGFDWAKIGMSPSPGRSLTDIFRSEKSGQVNPKREYVLIGKERHDIGRPNDQGYPIRGIVRRGMLYVENFETSRWPSGNPETGYLNCDGSPTKTAILEARRKNGKSVHWDRCFGKRSGTELFDLERDPDCVQSLAADAGSQSLKRELRELMMRELRAQGDPRAHGKGEIFDNYEYANRGQQNFHGRYTSGEKLRAGWVNRSDFEKEPLDDPPKPKP